MDMSFSDEFSFISVGASSNQEEDTMFFYSVPTSPSFQFKPSCSLYDFDLEGDEFEFDTSHRFLEPRDFETNQRKGGDEGRKGWDLLHVMAFADELFCDGKVLPLPLKLPPRLQNESGRKASRASSTASLSPRSLALSLRRTISGKSLWNDDFDPFMVALEVVREEEEKGGKPKAGDVIRRTMSELLIRSKGPNSGPYDLVCGGPNSGPCEFAYGDPTMGPCELASGVPIEPLMSESRRPKMVLSEPKGLVFARKARIIGLNKSGPDELDGPNRSKEESEGSGAWRKKRKKEKIMKFVFGKASSRYKLRDQEDDIVEVKKMTMTFYKPKLLLCLWRNTIFSGK